LHNAYYISPIFHTNSTLISHIIKAAKAVPHCFAMTNTIWQNQVPVIFLMVFLKNTKVDDQNHPKLTHDSRGLVDKDNLPTSQSG